MPFTNTTPRSVAQLLQRWPRRRPRAGRPTGSSRPRAPRSAASGSSRSSAAQSTSRRSRSASFTVSIERVDGARAAELGHDRLRHHARRDVGARWPACGSRRSGPRAGQVAHADPRADRLRERRRVHDVVALVHREHRGQRARPRSAAPRRGRPRTARNSCSVGQLDQPPALLQRQRAAGGVVEVGDDVGELGPRAALERLPPARSRRCRRPRAGWPAPRRPSAAGRAACGRMWAPRPPPRRPAPRPPGTGRRRPASSRWWRPPAEGGRPWRSAIHSTSGM